MGTFLFVGGVVGIVHVDVAALAKKDCVGFVIDDMALLPLHKNTANFD